MLSHDSLIVIKIFNISMASGRVINDVTIDAYDSSCTDSKPGANGLQWQTPEA